MTARMVLFQDGRAHFLSFDSSPEIGNRWPTFLCIILAVLPGILSELKKKFFKLFIFTLENVLFGFF